MFFCFQTVIIIIIIAIIICVGVAVRPMVIPRGPAMPTDAVASTLTWDKSWRTMCGHQLGKSFEDSSRKEESTPRGLWDPECDLRVLVLLNPGRRCRDEEWHDF